MTPLRRRSRWKSNRTEGKRIFTLSLRDAPKPVEQLMNLRNSRRSGGRRKRGGVAAAELAVCLPVIVLLVLAMIESCTMIFLKQSCSIAAYEGVRVALLEDADASDIRRTSQLVLTERRVKGGTIKIRPKDFRTLPVGSYIKVTVSAPADRNSVIPGNFFRGKTLSGTATMMKEL